jgi:hypothetical protein
MGVYESALQAVGDFEKLLLDDEEEEEKDTLNV